MIEVHVELIIRPDTEDYVEALQAADDLLASLKDGWYSDARIGSPPRVVEVGDDE